MAASKIARLDADLEPSTNRGGSVRRVTLATAASMVATDGAWPAAAIATEERAHAASMHREDAKYYGVYYGNKDIKKNGKDST